MISMISMMIYWSKHFFLRSSFLKMSHGLVGVTFQVNSHGSDSFLGMLKCLRWNEVFVKSLRLFGWVTWVGLDFFGWVAFFGLRKGAAGSVCFFRMLATCFEIVVLFLWLMVGLSPLSSWVVTTRISLFVVGDPKLNLHLPLASWEGGQSNQPPNHRCMKLENIWKKVKSLRCKTFRKDW